MFVLGGCGRLSFEPIENLAASDAATDGPRVCPADTSALSAGVTAGVMTCIEKAERGYMTWTDADAKCRSLNRRLCADAEWALACDQAAGLADMISDADGFQWEWVAEVANDQGSKRGYEFCGDIATHEIFVEPYDFRCCVDI